MYNYTIYINNLITMLDSFLSGERRIESKEAEEKINNFAGILKNHQFEILCEPLPEQEQNTIFNALRNLRITINEMKDQLKTALGRKENPTTAERCLALMPFIQNLSRGIDEFGKQKNESIILNISRDTRILRKKAREYNLLMSFENEMKEVDLPAEEIKTFCDELNKKIEIEMQEL